MKNLKIETAAELKRFAKSNKVVSINGINFSKPYTMLKITKQSHSKICRIA